MKTFLLAAGIILALFEMNLPAQGTPDASPTPAASPGTEKKPNILFIVADDLGFGDLGISGNPIIKTPNLDELARHSILCTDGHAAYPVCMPSRISIMTGKYSDRTGARMCSAPNPPKLDQPWLPHLLKTVGYSTCALGKWHLGNFTPEGIARVGFDTWAIDAPAALVDYWNYTIYRPNGVKEPSAHRYCTDVLTEEAIKFIDQNQDSGHPFFLYLAYNTPHFPLEAPEEEITPFKNRSDVKPGAAIVYAMVQHMDRKIGELLAHLKEKGLTENTIIVFTSDNGPEIGWNHLDETRWNDDLAGHKGLIWEGGIKVPTFISWPAVFGDHPKPFNGLVDGIDWQPTLCAAAGVTEPPVPIDGVNLLPRFLGKSTDPIPVRFWSYNEVRSVVFSDGAMRDGEWKLVRPPIPAFTRWGQPGDLPEPADIPDYQLFNLAQDPGEKHDVAAEQPERTQAMKSAFEAWFKDVTGGPDNVGLKITAPPRKTKRSIENTGE